MAGAGRKVFAFNEVLTAADVNQYLMDQSVMRFADETARTSAIGTPTEGMVSWLDDVNQVEVYDGTDWVNFTGDINQVTAGTALTGGGTKGNVTLDVDISAISTAQAGTALVATGEVLDVDIAAVGSAVSIEASQITDVTATAAELNILDGVTADATELNVLDGITATTTELNYTDGVTSSIQTQLDSKAPLAQSQKAQSTNYTLQTSDNGNIVKASGTITITVPDAVFSAGERVDIINEGSGVITFAAGSGFTILSKDSALTLDAQYKAATLVFETASQAFLIGDIA